MSYCFYSITRTVVYIYVPNIIIIYTTICDVGSTSSSYWPLCEKTLQSIMHDDKRKCIYLLFFSVNKLPVLVYDHNYVCYNY